VARPEESDDVTRIDDIAEKNSGFNGLESDVFVFQRPQHEDASAGNRSDERDKTRDGRSNLGPWKRLNVDSAMTGSPFVRWSSETVNHLADQGPGPSRCGFRSTDGGERDRQNQQKQQRRGNSHD
jgi:hypothetical protein